jgi:hypothetical protein
MKLNYFSEQTLPKQMGGGSKLPRVAFSKSGTITFNPAAGQLMGLKGGDKVTLAQDEEDPRNWYFFKDPQHGFELRPGYKDKGSMFNHKVMVQALLQAFGKPEDITHNFKIAGQPTVMKNDKTKYWGILI